MMNFKWIFFFKEQVLTSESSASEYAELPSRTFGFFITLPKYPSAVVFWTLERLTQISGYYY